MKRSFLSIIFALGLMAGLSGCGFEIVDTGHRGVETRYGKVVGESLPEGFYWYNPFSSSIIEMNVQTQIIQAKAETYTKDVQQAHITFAVNYNLQKDAAHLMYQEVGRNWEEVLVAQIVNGTLKSAIGKWDAVDLIANRDKATSAVEESIKTALAEKHVTITKFELADIKYDPEFEKAVEAKVTAIQRASEAENKTRQVQEEAKQSVIAAKAEAESMRIRAEALSQNKGLVDYEAVQKWDGKLPHYMMGNTVPFMNLTK